MTFHLNQSGYNQLLDELEDALLLIAYEGVKEARRRVHVRKGNLRDSIRVSTGITRDLDGLKADIMAGGITIRGVQVDYALAEETRHPAIRQGVYDGIRGAL